MKPTFANKQNTCLFIKPEEHRTVKPDDNQEYKEVWISRNVAVCVTLSHSKHVLLVERGPHMDNAGKFCMPCGYLDYNETLRDAAIRELYEETGIYDPAISAKLVHWNYDDKITSNRQNVTMNFGVDLTDSMTFDEFKQLIDLTVVDENEVSSIVFATSDDVKSMSMAFNHDDRVEQWFNFMNSTRTTIKPASAYKGNQLGLTVGELKKMIQDMPDDALVYTERIHDVYFESHGWQTVKSPNYFHVQALHINKEIDEEIERRNSGKEPEIFIGYSIDEMLTHKVSDERFKDPIYFDEFIKASNAFKGFDGLVIKNHI